MFSHYTWVHHRPKKQRPFLLLGWLTIMASEMLMELLQWIIFRKGRQLPDHTLEKTLRPIAHTSVDINAAINECGGFELIIHSLIFLI